MLYAIGDIHGQKAMLDHALALIEADGGPEARIVFLGDYTDRGPDSRGVLDTLIAGRDAGRDWHFVKGNHDRLFHDYLARGEEHDPHVKSRISWINKRLGGRQTLASYGVEGEPAFLHPAGGGWETLASYDIDGRTVPAGEVQTAARAAVPEAHVAFLASLPLMHREDDLIFVHAGIRPGVPLDRQVEDDLIWIRDGWLEDSRDHGPLVVHGHTALDRPVHYGNRVNLDGGAGYGRPLIPARIEGRDVTLLTDDGPQPLPVTPDAPTRP